MKIFWIIAGALVHTVIFIVVGLVVIFAIESLLLVGNLSSVYDVGVRYLENAWDSTWQDRRLPFALCVFANALVLPAAIGAWSTAASLAGPSLSSGNVAGRAMLCATAAYAAFIVSLVFVLAIIPFRIGIMASYGLVWYALVVLVWDALAIPLSPLSHRIVDGAIRTLRKSVT